MTKYMRKNIEYVASVVGDERLSASEVFEKSDTVTKTTILHWIIKAYNHGLLDREKVVRNQTQEYIYYAGSGYVEDIIDANTFTIDVFCPSCGQERKFALTTELRELHHKTWSCGGCGDMVRLWDCISWSDLSIAYHIWQDKDSDVEYGNAFVRTLR